MANFKFVKSATALVLGASVLTSAVVVPGANASAKTTYKVNKNGTLVNAKTNKTVKGYVSYKGKLYKDGKKFTGLYGSKKYYYKSGVKATGTYKGAYYVKGAKKVTTGTYNGKYYVKGALYTGKTSKNVYYVKGVKYTGVTKYGYTYKDGKRVEGEYQGKVYKNGKALTGIYKDSYYNNGVLNVGLAVFNEKLYKDGKVAEGLVPFGEGDAQVYYNNGSIADGDVNGVKYEKGKAVGYADLVATAVSKTEVEVKLPVAVDSVAKENFTLDNGATVESATLSEDKKSVALKVSNVKYDTKYKLAVKDVVKDGKAIDLGTVEYTSPALQDLYNLSITSTDKEVTADGADNTVVTFQLLDKKTNKAVDADDMVLEIGSTFGKLANTRVTVQDGVGKVVLASEFSKKEVEAKITAQIIEASGEYKDLIGKVAGETTIKFVPSTGAESNQADRVTLYFDKDVNVATFAKQNADGTYATTTVKDSLNTNVAAQVFAPGVNQLKVEQNGVQKTVVGFKKVEGNSKAIEVILAKNDYLIDNAKVQVTTKLGNAQVTQAFTLTDPREAEVTSVATEGLTKLNVKFSEAVKDGNFTIDGIWDNFSTPADLTVSYGDFNATTGVDARDTATITINKDVNGKNRYFTSGNHSLSVTQLKDFAGATDLANVSSAQKLDFAVPVDTSAPVASAVVESPEQFRVTFNKQLDTVNATQIFKDALVVKDSKGADVTKTLRDSIANSLVVTQYDNEFVVELDKDWTTLLTTNDSYSNYKLSFKLPANQFENVANGKKNVEQTLDLSYAGSPLATIDNVSPTIQSIETNPKNNKNFIVTMSEPVQLGDKVAAGVDNTPSTSQTVGVPTVIAEFQGKDKDGKDVVIPATVVGYADQAGQDKQLSVTAAQSIQDGVDAGTYQGNWKVVVKSISDDVGNTASTLTKDFTLTKASTAITTYQIVSPENGLADGVIAHDLTTGQDSIEVTFTKGVVNTGGDSDLTNASNWTLNGKALTDVASIKVVDTNANTTDGYEKVIITFNNANVLKASSNVIAVNKNIVSKDGTKLTGEFEVVATTQNN